MKGQLTLFDDVERKIPTMPESYKGEYTKVCGRNARNIQMKKLNG